MKQTTIKRVIRGQVEEIMLTCDEINAIIEEHEKDNLLEDVLKELHENYNVDSSLDEKIEKDKDKIYEAFLKIDDNNRSYLENINGIINYLKEYSNTCFNYSSI